MNVWIIKEGEPLPIKECIGRTMRSGIIAEMLADRGHNVTWWSSDFFHQTKQRLSLSNRTVKIRDNYYLVMLHPKTVYDKNISFERMVYCHQLGRLYKKSIALQEKPDVIICSFPLIEFAYESVKFAKKNNIPVLLDIRDLWPNIIWEKFPVFFRWAIKLLLFSTIRKTKYAIRKADRIIGVIPKTLDFAKQYGRKVTIDDKVFYLAYKERQYSKQERLDAIDFWKSYGLKSSDFIICWIGQISLQRTDFMMVADAIANLPPFKFVICGEGTSKNTLESKYKECSNIIFPGFLGQEKLEALMSMSSVGVIPIKNTPDFINTINNKSIEYMAGSLCVATTLKGLLRKTIEDNNIGFYFETSCEFKTKMLELYHNKNMLETYKNNSRAFFEQHFKSENVYGSLCNEIEDMVLKRKDH